MPCECLKWGLDKCFCWLDALATHKDLQEAAVAFAVLVAVASLDIAKVYPPYVHQKPTPKSAGNGTQATAAIAGADDAE